MTPPGFALPPAEALVAMHARALARDGGAPGLRDEEALHAALARPAHLLAFAPGEVDLPRFAAALAFAITRIRHPFVDGNKRMGFLALFVTLHMNGHGLDAPEGETAEVILAVASGALEEDSFADWVRRRCYRRDPAI